MQPALSWFSRERFAIVMLFSGILLAACLIPAQSDTWWQLRAGEEMWRTGRVMLHDEFTHTVSGGPWPNHEWLSHVLFYGLFSLGGLPLLTAFCAGAITLAWIIVFRLIEGPLLFRVAAVGFGALFSSPGWCLRPQVLTLALVAITLWILVRRRFVPLLPVIFVLWANLHGAVALGGVLVSAAWVSCVVTDRRALPAFSIVAALCLAATAATPLGFSLWLEVPHSLQRLKEYGVNEWRAPSLTIIGDLPFWGAAAATAALAWINRERLHAHQTLVLTLSAGLLFILATRSIRNVPPFLVVALPAAAALARLGAAGEREARRQVRWQLMLNAITLTTVLVGGVAFVVIAWRTPTPRLAWNPVPPAAVAALEWCPGPLYNRYDEGGYLIWFVRDRKVFMDSRQDPFPEELVKAHIELERTGEYRPLFDRYAIACALSAQGTPVARRLEADGWSARSAGQGWNVYRRPDVLDSEMALRPPSDD